MKRNITATLAQSVRANGARLDIWDENQSGLVLRVTPRGTKTWLVVYRQHGHRRRFTLGRFPQLGVADARQLARQRLGDVAGGMDPAGERAARKAELTFAQLAELYIEQHALVRNRPRTVDAVRHALRHDLLPAWGARGLSTIGRRDVIDLLDAIVARGAPINANRVLALISTMFNFAVDRELVDRNPAYRIHRPALERSRDRVLGDDEIRQLWAQLGRETTRIAFGFRLALLTAARSNEIFAMKWDELDLDDGWWVIPAARAKNKKSHRVPLVPTAIELLRELKMDAGNAQLVIRPGRCGVREVEREGAILTRPRFWLASVRRRAGLAHFTTHDLRRTVATKLTEMGVPRLTVSKLLNHSETGITHIYDRHTYDKEKREALLRWERRLREIVEPRHLHLVENDGEQRA
jgi:integrase